MSFAKKYTILPFETRFFTQIVEIERSSFREPYALEHLRLLTTWHPELFLTAVSNDSVLGYAVASANGNQGHMVSLAVRPEYRRLGIGTNLLESLLKRLQSAGVRKVLLEVREDNVAAAALYNKLGFKRLSRIDRYYEDGCGAIVYEMSLPNHCGRPNS